MTVDNFTHTSDMFPPGAVIPWNESLSEIPPGWVLCDGNNGTANLLDKFVMSVPDSTTDPGTVVGQHSYSLSTTQIPKHSHSVSVDSSGKHEHSQQLNESHAYTYGDNNALQNLDEYGDSHGQTTTTDGSHTHTTTVNNTGSGNSIDNRPSYHEVAYIQKL